MCRRWFADGSGGKSGSCIPGHILCTAAVLALWPAAPAEAQYAWEPPTNKVVVLAVNAHPDDEGIFFGGTLPYYSAALKVPTVLLSMTSGDWISSNLTVRENELRCAAWAYGLRYEPLFPRFRDVPSQSLNPNPYTNRIDATWDYWADGVLQGDGNDVEAGKLRAINYVAEQIRRLRPEVVFTHDLRGEYGHDNHRATAYAVTNAFFVAADPSADAPTLTGLAPWQAKKLYLHLYPNNRLFHRFLEMPLAELGERSARQVADAGLDCHVSQGRPDVSTVYRTGENFEGYHSEWWGLYASTVGPDPVLTHSLEVGGYIVPAGWSTGNFLENLGLDPALTRPVIRGIERKASGEVRLLVSGAPGMTYVVEATSNLVSPVWEPLGTNTAGVGSFELVDSEAGHQAMGFYRAVAR